jgi:phage terminase large subunit GpA-like protein
MVFRASDMASIPSLFDFIAPETAPALSEWSDQYRVLTSRSAAEPGPYRSARTPYLRSIMDDLSVESPVRRMS